MKVKKKTKIPSGCKNGKILRFFSNSFSYILSICLTLPVLGPAGCDSTLTPEPIVVTASDDQIDQISINWTPAVKAVSYYLYKSDACNGTYERIWKTNTATSYTDTNVVRGATSFYKVSYVNRRGRQSELSHCAEGNTPDCGDGEMRIENDNVFFCLAGQGRVPQSEGIDKLTDCIRPNENLQEILDAGFNLNLCPNEVYRLDETLRMKANGQVIYTQGAEDLDSYAILKIVNSSVGTAIDGTNLDNIRIEKVSVDGNRPELGVCNTDKEALIKVGVLGKYPIIRHTHLKNTRTWSSIHAHEGPAACKGAVIEGNIIHSAGCDIRRNGCIDDDPDHSWSDGISLACKNSFVNNNLIIDATDGAIVVFGAPGSTIRDNVIVAGSRDLLGGINLVDKIIHIVEGDESLADYRGTRVENNIIIAKGAKIYTGIAMGAYIWSFPDSYDYFCYGATVANNTLEGPLFGYGFVANGIRNFTVTGNISNATHIGKGDGTDVAADGGFQSDADRAASADGNILQPEFIKAHGLRNLLMFAEAQECPPAYTVFEAEEIVKQIYRDILQREADSDELTYYRNYLTTSCDLNSDEIRKIIMQSSEFINNFGQYDPQKPWVYEQGVREEVFSEISKEIRTKYNRYPTAWEYEYYGSLLVGGEAP